MANSVRRGTKILLVGVVLTLAQLGLTRDAVSQEKDVFEIAILIDGLAPQADSLLALLKTEIVSVVGEDADIRFPDSSFFANDYNSRTAAEQYQEVVQGTTKIILAFGPVIADVITKQTAYPKPTILFGAINSDLAEVDESRTVSGIDNFIYLVTTQSYKHDLSTFKSIYDFQNIGVVIAGTQAGVLDHEIALNRILTELNSSYELIHVSEPSDLADPLRRVDAIYLAEGFGLSDETIREMAQMLIDNRVPSFVATRREDVEQGWMATNQAAENLQLLFRRIALNVDAVIRGENLADRPLLIEQGETLTINYNTAEAVGVPIKYSSITTTDFVGEFKNVVSEKTYSLIDFIEEVRSTNLDLETSRTELALSKQELRAAKSSYLPSIFGSATGSYLDPAVAEISGGQNPEYSTAGNLSVSQVLFSSGLNTNIGIQKDLVDAQQENHRRNELDVILTAARTYLTALSLKTNAAIRKQNLDVTRQNLKIAEQNLDAGQQGKADVLRLRSEVAQNTQSLVEAISQLEQGFYSINQLVNKAIDREIDVEEVSIGQGIFAGYNYERVLAFIDNPQTRKVFVDFLVAEARANAPELHSLNYNISAIDRSIRQNESRFYLPTVAFQAQYNRTFEQWGVGAPPPEAMVLNDNYSAGLNLSIPIFDQNRRQLSKQKSQIQLKQLHLARDATELALERAVQDAILELINQISNIELSEVSEETAEESLDLTQAAYSAGAVNISELLDAQRNYFSAQLARANASYDFLLSSLMLERTIGHFFLLHSQDENDEFLNRYLEYANESQQ